MKPNPPLPETYIEILTYLRDNEKGMTTRQLFDLAQKKRYYNLRDSTQISYIVNTLRSKQLITTSDAAGGKIHWITDAGIEAIAEEAPEKETKSVSEYAVAKAADTMIADIQREHPEQKPDDSNQPEQSANLIESFDVAVNIIRGALVTAMEIKEAPKVANKEIKLQVLNRLAEQFNEEISRVLTDIVSDLEQLETQS